MAATTLCQHSSSPGLSLFPFLSSTLPGPRASEVTILWRYTNTFIIVIIIIFYIFTAHQHKAAGRKTRLDIQNYGCNGNLLCYHGVVGRNRISSLQSHGKALEKECCLPGVFCDSGDTPANLLCELNGHLMP